MTVRLIKCSEPGWERDFETMGEAIDELRLHICALCFAGEAGDPDGPIDRDCRDADVLLNSPCGLEFEIEEHAA